MKTISTIVVRITIMLGLLAAGFALGFPLGQHKGFDTGSEWAIVQADIAAREAGMSLPFSLEEGHIRVTVKQSPDLHKWAQQQAALYNDRITVTKAVRTAIPPVGVEAAD